MTGTDNLAALENNVDLLRVDLPANVATARDELLATESVRGRSLLLGEWTVRFPNATQQLLRVVARDPIAAVALAPAVLATRVLEEEDVDDILVAAFPQLAGAIREAATDRDGVQQRLGISPVPGTSVSPPEPAWLWPMGMPFPSVETVKGVQARLNYLGLGAGPVDGEWTERTRRAFIRWQVLNAFEPSGELEWDTADHLGITTPDAPD